MDAPLLFFDRMNGEALPLLAVYMLLMDDAKEKNRRLATDSGIAQGAMIRSSEWPAFRSLGRTFDRRSTCFCQFTEKANGNRNKQKARHMQR